MAIDLFIELWASLLYKRSLKDFALEKTPCCIKDSAIVNSWDLCYLRCRAGFKLCVVVWLLL